MCREGKECGGSPVAVDKPQEGLQKPALPKRPPPNILDQEADGLWGRKAAVPGQKGRQSPGYALPMGHEGPEGGRIQKADAPAATKAVAEAASRYTAIWHGVHDRNCKERWMV